MFQLESWFKTSSNKKPNNQRPTSGSLTTRPSSETEFGDPDEEYARTVECMNETEVNSKIEELLVSIYKTISVNYVEF